MAKKGNYKRIRFPEGQQEIFIQKIASGLMLSNVELARLSGVHSRTFNGWRRGEYLMPYSVALKLANKAGISFPKSAQVEDQYWYTHIGAQAGWEVIKKKYGRVPTNEKHRQKKWREWWEKTGQYTAHKIINRPRSFTKPYQSKYLAEFVGAMIGDGGITERQINVTLHRTDDRDYAFYLKTLMEKLFKVSVALRDRKKSNVINLTISRTRLVEFCRDKLGLKVGDKIKQGLDVPDWIMDKRIYRKACLRGLWDTDGCVFNECHRIKNKKYCYPRLNFTSASPQLCNSVMTILKDFGFNPVMRGSRRVQLERRTEIIDYFQVIGTNNPKHQKRFEKFIRRS